MPYEASGTRAGLLGLLTQRRRGRALGTAARGLLRHCVLTPGRAGRGASARPRGSSFTGAMSPEARTGTFNQQVRPVREQGSLRGCGKRDVGAARRLLPSSSPPPEGGWVSSRVAPVRCRLSTATLAAAALLPDAI
jgi:hypothetical protein